MIKNDNDLSSLYPLIASQWNYERNGETKPDQVTPYSNRKVWWKCPAGHIWKAAISSRTGNYCGCPVCAGKKNSPYYDVDPRELEQRILASANENTDVE